MRHLWVTLLSCFLCVAAVGQKVTVGGLVTEKNSGEACIAANVVLLSPRDSSMVAGVNTSLEGRFALPAVDEGSYILRITYVGYQTHFQNLTLSKERAQVDLGNIRLDEDARLLRETFINHNVAQVEQRADTFVFNAAAFRVPPGSTLEALVNKLPGVDVDDEGKITVNGKEVKRILVSGKEFFGGNVSTAMQNIPTEMVDRIRAYDRQSDYSRMTGIDDGEEETVLDLTVKHGMNEGWLFNFDAGGGLGIFDVAPGSGAYTRSIGRYAGKATIQRYTDNTQAQFVFNANNINDLSGMGGGRGGRFRGGRNNGIITRYFTGINLAIDNGLRESQSGYLEFGGNARFEHKATDSESKSNSETFIRGEGSRNTFSNNVSSSQPWEWSVNSEFRFEWQIDSLTKLLLRPSYSYSRNHGMSTTRSVTFSDDPYRRWSDPLNMYKLDGEVDRELVVNDNERFTMSDGYTSSFNANIQLNRRLGRKGRNLTFDGSAGYQHRASESWAKNLGNYYQSDRVFNNQHKYNDNPSTNWNVRGRLSYTEPIARNLNLQLSYSLQYRFSDSDRSQYELDSLLARGIISAEQLESWVLGTLPTSHDELERYAKDWENSQYATYREYNHEANLMFRYSRGDLRLNAGVSLQPHTTEMQYRKHQVDTTITRHVFNWAPRVTVRWKISNTSQLNLRYNGYMTQPSMTNLLEIDDTNDPLNISRGNASLDPTFTHNVRFMYNNYITERQMGWAIGLDCDKRQNDIANATVYDNATGARYTRPMNIDGNWSGGFFGGFNTALDSAKAWNMHLMTHLRYSNNVGYETTSRDVAALLAEQGLSNATTSRCMDAIFAQTSLRHTTTRQLNTGGRLNFSYRNQWIEVGPQGSINYSRARNNTMAQGNMDTWTFGYGGNLQITLPWNMTLTTDLTQQGRRGFDDKAMNTNELVWNLQLSQSFFSDNSLIVSIKAYDILHERSAISRALTATMRRDSWSKEINTYVMLHVTYKINLLGRHASRANMNMDGMMPPPGAPAGPPPGGGGGGRRGGGGHGGGMMPAMIM